MQHMLGGLIGGDVTVQRTTKEAAQGKGARGGFECISDAAQTRGEVARMEAPVDGVLYRTLPVDEASDEADVNGE